jgi:hypothetical protein
MCNFNPYCVQSTSFWISLDIWLLSFATKTNWYAII